MIKPDFFDSESIGACTIAARLAFIGLWVMGDDYGNQKAQISRLRLRVFPYDAITDDDFIGLLAELEETECIKGYVVDDEPYITVTNFTTYQTVKKPSKSNVPEPPDAIKKQKRTTLFLKWHEGTPPVPHQYPTSDPKERKKEGREESFTGFFSNEYSTSIAGSEAALHVEQSSIPVCPNCGNVAKYNIQKSIWSCDACKHESKEPTFRN